MPFCISAGYQRGGGYRNNDRQQSGGYRGGYQQSGGYQGGQGGGYQGKFLGLWKFSLINNFPSGRGGQGGGYRQQYQQDGAGQQGGW